MRYLCVYILIMLLFNKIINTILFLYNARNLKQISLLSQHHIPLKNFSYFHCMYHNNHYISHLYHTKISFFLNARFLLQAYIL